MRPFAAIALCAALTGCATPYDPTPNIHDITDNAAVAKDVSDCAAYAGQYKRPLNVGSVAASGGTGLGNSLGTGVVGGSTFAPLGPVLGGLGGILSALANYFGLIDTDTPKAAQQCLRQRLDRDRAGILVEPPL